MIQFLVCIPTPGPDLFALDAEEYKSKSFEPGDAFADILTILKSKPNIVQKLYKALCKELLDNMTEDLEDILREGSLQDGLEKVAKLIDLDSSVTEDAWRPPGNIFLHLRSLDAQIIKEESELLEKRVNEIEEENAILMKEVTHKRTEIMTINDSITRSLSRSSIVQDLLEKRMEGLEKCITLLHRE
ncbi:hypothetical protein WN48_11233 [Eufriesea mexicana]|uniref:Polyamine-modulated factor 1 n=1 Tax=Eufriesea mexicana TaxID=516756 RepID=A0A310SN49_9HYME|nr:hypothetical protein WN48_11233 [Eufriesea mexicana]